ncbi:MAG: ABC transporter substrate-binding protein [Alphaproteobacteria bacterium]|nr:ABC transporter substrate-binding protein [Alphaproteobacteria bacterium]
MNFRTLTLAAAGAAIALGTTGALAADTQKIASLVYRTGPYAPNGISLADGYADYFNLINERDGGVGGVKFSIEECDTGYKTDRGVECYDRIAKGTTVLSPWSTGITYALIEKATADKVPILSMGYGRTSAADGRVFPYVFNFPATYWSQATSVVQYIANEKGGVENLKGKNFAFIYLDHPYGREPIPTLDVLAEKFGFTYDRYPVPPASMTEQKSIWLQIRKTRPDYAIMWGWGAMNATAIKEAASIKYPMDKFIGNWWSGDEADVTPAGQGSVGYKAATFNGVGTNYKIYEDLKKHLYDAGKASGNGDRQGRVLYNRGLANGAYVVEALRTAQAKFGERVLTGEEMRWGLENLKLTAERIEELGLTGLVPPTEVTCLNHEGTSPAIMVQQWDGQNWEIKTDWIPAMTDIVRPLIEKDAAQYAAENNITPQSCS